MYRGYNLELDDTTFLDTYNRDENYLTNERNIKTALNELVSLEGQLLASKIEENWFPSVNASIFISHSHKDKELAKKLSAWLKANFGLNSFIDSCVWGYSDSLLKQIDNEYCLLEDGAYDYNKRNRSTSHIHMLLSVALSKMIDKCECVIFLNTPSSISAKETINSGLTESPWLYSEIVMTNLIRKKSPDQHRNVMAMDSVELRESRQPEVVYKLDFNHLFSINEKDLLQWKSTCSNSTGTNALSKFYVQTDRK